MKPINSLKRIAAIALLMALSFACDTEYFSQIPQMPVLLNINLSTTDITLVPVTSSKSFTAPRTVSERVGYGGILVYHGTEGGTDKFFAYDLACPVEVKSDVRVVVENTLFAKCPVCGSVFEIYSGFGNPTSGPALQKNFSLRKYTSRQSDNEIFIYN